MSRRLWPTPLLFAPLALPYLVARSLITTVLHRPPDHLRCNTRHQGRPTCGEPPTVVRCVTTAAKPVTSTVAAPIDNSACEASLSTHRAPCPANYRARSMSTYLRLAVNQPASAVHRHPTETDQRAPAATLTSHVEGPPAQEGETKSSSFGR